MSYYGFQSTRLILISIMLLLLIGLRSLKYALVIIASIISRGARFFLVATLLYFFGKKIEELLIKRFGLICTILFLIILIIYFIMKYLGFI